MILRDWLVQWRAGLKQNKNSPNIVAAAMNTVNPIYIPRNHLVEHALEQAESGSFAEFETLLGVLGSPFEPKQNLDGYQSPAPDSFGAYKTFCGT